MLIRDPERNSIMKMAIKIVTVQEAGSRLQLHLEVGTHDR